MSVQIVEELAARLGLEIDGEAFAVAEKLLGAVRGGMVGLAAAGAAVGMAVVAAAAKTAAYADATAKAAERTGIAVDSLQALQYAAERADVSAGDLEGALRFAAKRGVKDLEGELLRAAEQFERMPDGAEKAALAMKLFGKQGTALIPMLNKGTAGLDEMTAKAQDMGLVLGADTQEQAAALKDTLEDVQGYLRGLAYTIAGPFLKPIREALERLAKWIREHRPQIQRAFEAIGTAIGTAMKYAAQLIEPVIDLLWRLGGAILGSTTGRVLAALAAFGFALTLPFAGPVIAIGALLVALEELWGWITGERDTLLEDTFGPFADFKKDFLGWLSFDATDSPLVLGLKGILILVKELFGYLRDSVTMWDNLLSKGSINPGFNRENAGGTLKFGLRSLFGDSLLRGILTEQGQAALYEGSTFAVPQQFQAPAAPTSVTGGSRSVAVSVNVTAPAGVDAQSWADQLGAALAPHVERAIDARNAAALPAAAR
jgi:hypothetical protein